MQSKDLTLIAMMCALLVVLGFSTYMIGQFLAFPGAKYFVMAPFLSLTQYFPLVKTQKLSSLLMFNGVLALFLLTISLWMSLAIMVNALIAWGIMVISRPVLGFNKGLALGLSFYPAGAFVSYAFVAIYVTGLHAFGSLLSPLVVVGSVICAGLGYIGFRTASLIDQRLNKNKIRK